MRKKKVLVLEKSTHSSRAQDRALVYLAGYLWAHGALSNSAGTRHLWARTALSNSAGPLTRIQATSIDLIMGNTPSSAAAHAPITTPAGLRHDRLRRHLALDPLRIEREARVVLERRILLEQLARALD